MLPNYSRVMAASFVAALALAACSSGTSTPITTGSSGSGTTTGGGDPGTGGGGATPQTAFASPSEAFVTPTADDGTLARTNTVVGNTTGDALQVVGNSLLAANSGLQQSGVNLPADGIVVRVANAVDDLGARLTNGGLESLPIAGSTVAQVITKGDDTLNPLAKVAVLNMPILGSASDASNQLLGINLLSQTGASADNTKLLVNAISKDQFLAVVYDGNGLLVIPMSDPNNQLMQLANVLGPTDSSAQGVLLGLVTAVTTGSFANVGPTVENGVQAILKPVDLNSALNQLSSVVNLGSLNGGSGSGSSGGTGSGSGLGTAGGVVGQVVNGVTQVASTGTGGSSGLGGTVSGAVGGVTGAVGGLTSGVTGSSTGLGGSSGLGGTVGGLTSGLTGPSTGSGLGGSTGGSTGGLVTGVVGGVTGAVGGLTSGLTGGSSSSGSTGAVGGLTGTVNGLLKK